MTARQWGARHGSGGTGVSTRRRRARLMTSLPAASGSGEARPRQDRGGGGGGGTAPPRTGLREPHRLRPAGAGSRGQHSPWRPRPPPSADGPEAPGLPRSANGSSAKMARDKGPRTSEPAKARPRARDASLIGSHLSPHPLVP